MPWTQTLEFRLYVGHMERRKEVSTLMRGNRRGCRFCSNIARITFCSTRYENLPLSVLEHKYYDSRVVIAPFCVFSNQSRHLGNLLTLRKKIQECSWQLLPSCSNCRIKLPTSSHFNFVAVIEHNKSNL